MEDDSLAISGEHIFNPGHQRADFGVNARVVRLSTALAPGDDTLQLSITHQRTTRVTLSVGEGRKLQFLHSIISSTSMLFCMFTVHHGLFKLIMSYVIV